MESRNAAYSYHTFILPFSWDREQCADLNTVFQNQEGSSWHISADDNRNRTGLAKLNMNRAEDRELYLEYQYFNSAARHVLYADETSNIVHSYEYDKAQLAGAKYEIVVKEGERYRLEIDKIGLKIFNTGIALLYLDCSNREEAQFNLTAVKAINEYGRRISLSFWPEKNGFKKCADKLVFSKGEDLQYEENFKEYIEEAKSGASQEVSLTYLSYALRRFLDDNGSGVKFRCRQTTGIQGNELKEIVLYPIVDGKMFVSCLIVDPTFMARIQEAYRKGDGSFPADMSAELAELFDVDLEGECSRKNPASRESFLRESLYMENFDPDAEGAKLAALTSNSYVKLVNREDYDLTYHFCVYNEIVFLGLLQRMSIANFAGEISRISYGIERPGKKMTNKLIFRIMALQERFVAFQNQILLYEVTPQREGKWLYRRIREALNIDEENENLTGKLSGIYELANINQGYVFNKWALVLSVAAMIFTVFAQIDTSAALSEYSFTGYPGYLLLLVQAALCALVLVLILKVKYRK